MNNVLNSRLFLFVAGFVIATCITSVVAYQMTANQISYTPKDKNWNVNNVKSAVDDLKETCSSRIFAVIKSGDVNTIGSVVEIGNEEFYVVGQGTGKESGKTKLLTKKVINNNVQSSTCNYLKFATTKYWVGKVGDGLQYPGNYSGNPYPYVYDENSSLYSVVNNYVNKIKLAGVSKATGRLLSHEETVALPSDIRNIGEYYWTGSADSDNNVTGVFNDGTMYSRDISSSTRCVRPVILVPTNQIG